MFFQRRQRLATCRDDTATPSAIDLWRVPGTPPDEFVPGRFAGSLIPAWKPGHRRGAASFAVTLTSNYIVIICDDCGVVLCGRPATMNDVFASSFVPRTNLGIGFRDAVTRLLRIPVVADYFIGRDLRDDLRLPASGV
jgi:hypothetical protein